MDCHCIEYSKHTFDFAENLLALPILNVEFLKTDMILNVYTCFPLLQQVTGEISYNGYMLDEFVPQKTSAYISQEDLHIAEMTVREILDFSAQCQGVGSRAGTFP